MTMPDIANQRLQNQHLLTGLADPLEVVRSLGAMQSQDFTGAKWAIGQRCKDTTDAAVTELFNQGKILRTHMLRPTWHFVAAEDIRWMQALTAPRVHAFNKYYYKKLGLDETTLKKGVRVLQQALGGGQHLTRDELKEIFRQAGIDASGLKLAYLIMYAELEAIVCSGVLKGNKHTIALLSERVSAAKPVPHEQALAEFTRRFFGAHGPATIQDFVWWSSLSVSDVKKGIELAKLTSIEVEGKTFYTTKVTAARTSSPIVHLLPNYDEYVIAYKERGPYMGAKLGTTPTYEDLSYHFVMLDGQLVGGWKRTVLQKSVTVHLNLFKRLTPPQSKALSAAAEDLGHFMQLPVLVA